MLCVTRWVSLSMTAFVETYLKAQRLLNGSAVLRAIAQSEDESSESAALRLSVENVLAVILYTDFDALCAQFLSSFAPESDAERHREFWWLARTLRSTVQNFGRRSAAAETETLFLCADYRAMHRFELCVARPLSLTASLQCAVLYSHREGLIVEVSAVRCLKFFDCAFVSAQSGECERLCFGADPKQFLSVSSVRDLESNLVHCAADSFSALSAFAAILSGRDILQILWDADYQRMSALISARVLGEALLDSFVVRCFDALCAHFRALRVSLRCLYNFAANFLSLHCANLLLFDNLSILCANAERIECRHVGRVDAKYLSRLRVILEHIELNKRRPKRTTKRTKTNPSKVRTLRLCEVELDLNQAQMNKFEAALKNRVGWTCQWNGGEVIELNRLESRLAHL